MSLVVVTLILMVVAPTIHASKRTCFCEINLGPQSFSKRLLHVQDPILVNPFITCKKAGLWCPLACYKAARKRLLNGGAGDVAPFSGAAGETACNALMTSAPANTTLQLHVYATYRVSNCGPTGYHYLGRLCCWEYLVGDSAIYKFNEHCLCGPKPPCDPTTTTPDSTATTTTTAAGTVATTAATTTSVGIVTATV